MIRALGLCLLLVGCAAQPGILMPTEVTFAAPPCCHTAPAWKQDVCVDCLADIVVGVGAPSLAAQRDQHHDQEAFFTDWSLSQVIAYLALLALIFIGACLWVIVQPMIEDWWQQRKEQG